MRIGLKARPFDLDEVTKLNPHFLEIHATSEDLKSEIRKQYDLPLVVHLPEYDGQELMDIVSFDDKKRIHAFNFYNKALEIVRKWGSSFKGTPKAILHPGGWSNEPIKAWDVENLYNIFFKTIKDLNTTGIDFLVENMPPQPWFYGGQWHCNIFLNPYECRDYCIGNGIGFCLDICHAYLWCNYIKEMNIIKYMDIVRPIIGHIHISDGNGTNGEGLQIGKGEMPLQSIVDYIKNINVGIVPEIWQGHKDNYAGFLEARKLLESYNVGTN